MSFLHGFIYIYEYFFNTKRDQTLLFIVWFAFFTLATHPRDCPISEHTALPPFFKKTLFFRVVPGLQQNLEEGAQISHSCTVCLTSFLVFVLFYFVCVCVCVVFLHMHCPFYINFGVPLTISSNLVLSQIYFLKETKYLYKLLSPHPA